MINRAVNSLSFAIESPFIGALTMTGLAFYHRNFLGEKINQVKAKWLQISKQTPDMVVTQTFQAAYNRPISSNHQNPFIGIIHDLFIARLLQLDFLSVRKFFLPSSYIPNATAAIAVTTNRLSSLLFHSSDEVSGENSSPTLKQRILKCFFERAIEVGIWKGLIKVINHYPNLSPRLLKPILLSLESTPPLILHRSCFIRCVDIVLSCI